MAKDPRRVAYGRLGGLALSATHDPRVYTQKAREAFRSRFLDEVDPDGTLRETDPEEAARRAEAARKLFYARMAVRSVESRRRKSARKRTPPTELS